jgi:hypothetical protein
MDRPWTPGPWFVRPTPTRAGLAVIEDGRESGLFPITCEWSEASLIAAAPEMADSLDPDSLDAVADELEVFVHSARILTLRGIAKRQRAALAKARGETMEPGHG